MPDPSSAPTTKSNAAREGSTAVLLSASSLGRVVPADIRDVSFRSSVRGYERAQVDRYVERVNQLIAELEIARSPETAVRHALDRVGEQTTGILQQARETADSIMDAARAEAEEALERATAESAQIMARAQREAAAIVGDAGEEAHERVQQGERELAAARARSVEAHEQADAALAQARSHAGEIVEQAQRRTDAILQERRRVVEEAEALAEQLMQVAGGRVEESSAAQEQPTQPYESAPEPRKPRKPGGA